MTVRLLTAREVADRLGLSAETILRWTRRGDLPAIRLPGGAIRYRESDLERWLASRATVADTADNTKRPGGAGDAPGPEPRRIPLTRPQPNPRLLEPREGT
jgi:excisionase family DNA binding protein